MTPDQARAVAAQLLSAERFIREREREDRLWLCLTRAAWATLALLTVALWGGIVFLILKGLLP